MKKESIVAGAAILTAAGIVTRLIGFYYRIYMTGIIGSEGVGLYQLIMPLYLLAWTITSSGITTAVSSLTAKYSAKKQWGECINILKTALIITAVLSTALGILTFLSANILAEFILKDIRAAMPLKVISLCFPFMSMGSSIRGFLFGIQNSTIPATSQIIEQLVRVFSVMTIFSFYSPKNLESACAVTASGIALGEFISFIFTLINFIKLKKGLDIPENTNYNPKKYLSLILAPAIPLSSGRIIASGLSALENILIPQRLILYGYTESNALSIYGKLTGMAMPLIQFPTAVLMSFSTALIPAISAADNIKTNVSIKRTIEKSLLFSLIAGVWALTIFIFYPKQISYFLYSQSSLGAYVIRLAPLCPILYVHITLTGILNGIGRQRIIFINNIISSFINLVFIYVLMPVYGIYVFAAGMFISLLITSLISIFVIKKVTGIDFNFAKSLLKPMVCCVSSGIVMKLLPIGHGFSRLDIITSSAAITLLYFLFIMLSGCLKKEDIKIFMPGNKIKS